MGILFISIESLAREVSSERIIFKSNLPKLIEEKAKKDGKRCAITAIARDTQVHRQTIYIWLDPDREVEYIGLKSVVPLAQYFGCEWYDLVRCEVVE